MPKKALKELEKYSDRLLLLPSFEALAEPVSAHPDMLIFPCPEQRILFTHKDYLSIAEDELGCLEFNILAIEEKAERDYPRDILLNAAVVGEKLIGRLAYISRSVMSYAQGRNMELIDVKQGYAKCSVCTVAENALITADPSISKAAKLGGIDVLDISEDGILLDGYDHGFIGGASGTDGERVFFCGN
ncbi:MAG: hypothetical protein IJZ89_07250, partial [Clostridia bacterium]|nr:hypothetical protein [Clostridia bacterium]